jgi:hypothetical protein|nr:MAG TPA: hypothetical protein [Caudoviricetes sp.]
MFYEVIAQFAKADAPSFKTPGYEGYLSEARDYFNMRSRVATNPKEITELHVIDEKTVRIILRSQDQLKISQVSRSLRVFSMYLIDESHPLNFSELVSGKRLFKMSASEFGSGDDSDLVIDEGENSEDDLQVLKTMISLLDDAKVNRRAKEVKDEILGLLVNYREGR